jgi:hypothetical protein
MRQAGKKIRSIMELEVGTALSADRMRPSRLELKLKNFQNAVKRRERGGCDLMKDIRRRMTDG